MIHKLPLVFERYVEELYDSKTGKLIALAIPAIELIPDGRIDLVRGQKVRVIIDKY